MGSNACVIPSTKYASMNHQPMTNSPVIHCFCRPCFRPAITWPSLEPINFFCNWKLGHRSVTYGVASGSGYHTHIETYEGPRIVLCIVKYEFLYESSSFQYVWFAN